MTIWRRGYERDWSIDAICTAHRASGHRLAFTNGCFDILHVGHLHTLQEARRQGEILIVGLNSDKSVARLKGPGRPYNNQKDRARLLSGLFCVDYVTLFEEDTPLELIKRVRPDVLIKGGDYQANDILGKDFVKEYGGEVLTTPFLAGRSTTDLLHQLRSERTSV